MADTPSFRILSDRTHTLEPERVRLTEPTLLAVKRASAAWAPDAKSAHLSEAIAAGFGHKSNTSLKLALRRSGTLEVSVDWRAADKRIADLGHTAPMGWLAIAVANVRELVTADGAARLQTDVYATAYGISNEDAAVLRGLTLAKVEPVVNPAALAGGPQLPLPPLRHRILDHSGSMRDDSLGWPEGESAENRRVREMMAGLLGVRPPDAQYRTTDMRAAVDVVLAAIAQELGQGRQGLEPVAQQSIGVTDGPPDPQALESLGSEIGMQNVEARMRMLRYAQMAAPTLEPEGDGEEVPAAPGQR